MGGEIALPLEKVPQVVGVEVHDPGVIGRRRQGDRSGGRIGLGDGSVDLPRQLGAAGGDAIIADALVDPALGLQRPGEIGAENAAQRHQHEARPQRPFEAGVRQREIRMRDEGGDQQIAEKNMHLPPAHGGFRRQARAF